MLCLVAPVPQTLIFVRENIETLHRRFETFHTKLQHGIKANASTPTLAATVSTSTSNPTSSTTPYSPAENIAQALRETLLCMQPDQRALYIRSVVRRQIEEHLDLDSLTATMTSRSGSSNSGGFSSQSQAPPTPWEYTKVKYSSIWQVVVMSAQRPSTPFLFFWQMERWRCPIRRTGLQQKEQKGSYVFSRFCSGQGDRSQFIGRVHCEKGDLLGHFESSSRRPFLQIRKEKNGSLRVPVRKNVVGIDMIGLRGPIRLKAIRHQKSI
jgi:hypothetical protein